MNFNSIYCCIYVGQICKRNSKLTCSRLKMPFLRCQHIEAETKGRHFADDIFKCIFLNENVWIPIKISLKFVPKGPIYIIPAMVQIMAWCRPGDKPLSEPRMESLLTHICVTRLQWVNLIKLLKKRVPHLCSKIPKINNWSMDNGVHSVCFRCDFAINTVVGFLR